MSTIEEGEERTKREKIIRFLFGITILIAWVLNAIQIINEVSKYNIDIEVLTIKMIGIIPGLSLITVLL